MANKTKFRIKNRKLKIRKDFYFILLIIFFFFIDIFLLLAEDTLITPKVEEVKGFVMTIVDKGGEQKAVISGSTANVLPNGLIEIIDVVARVFGRGGDDTDTLIHSAKGIYQRGRNIVTTDQFVRINRRNMVITGTGLEWYPDKSRLEIDKNVRVEYFSEQILEKEDPSASPEKRVTVISAQGSGLIDYKGNVAIFKKKVCITDPDATLKTHTAKIFLEQESQQLKRVEAYGNVRIKQPKRISLSQKAVYYMDQDKIVLSGNPRIIYGLDLYAADRVTIYDKGERVIFEPRAHLVIYQGTEHKGI